MPDNSTQGTLEDLLLDAAGIHYADLTAHAENYLKQINRSALTQKDLEEINKPAGEKKAQIAVVGSILKPGKSIQVSIEDNRWLDGPAKTSQHIGELRLFLQQLLNEPAI